MNLKKLTVRFYITIKTFNHSPVISFYSYADIMRDSNKCKMKKGLRFEMNENLFTNANFNEYHHVKIQNICASVIFFICQHFLNKLG